MLPISRERTGSILPYAVILLAALLATSPLLIFGPSCGHDLPFHLLNWMDAAHQWRMGVLRPWWCSAAAWNTGEARFLFYPPASWTLGGLLTLVLGAARAPVAYTFLALTACGITMRRFLASYVAPSVALLGACLYLAHPYMLFTATERTAYAELLAAAWLPSLLHGALRPRISAHGLAIPVALLWLTNTPSAVLATYTLAIIVAFRVGLGLRSKQAITRPVLLPAAIGYAWGIGISALYLLPALVQHNAVEVGQAFTSGMRPEDGTLFAHTGEPLHDQVVHQASVLAIILLGGAVIAAMAVFAERRPTRLLHGMRELQHAALHDRQRRTLVPTLLTLSGINALLLTRASLPLWNYMPELHFLQFPWRTLMLQGVVTVTLIVLGIRWRLRQRWAIAIGWIAVVALSFTAHHGYAQFCDGEDAPASLRQQYVSGSGFEPYDEYTPLNADNDLIHPGEPAAWTAAEPTAPPSVSAATHVHVAASGSPNALTVQANPGATDHFLVIRQRAFRNWHVTLDGKPVQRTADRDDDLLAIPLPTASTHTVELAYGWSSDQVAGLLISLLAVFGLVILRPHSQTRTSPR